MCVCVTPSASAAQQVSVIGGLSCANKVLKESVVITSVEPSRENWFVVTTSAGATLAFEAPSLQAKLEWIRTMKAGLERARSDAASGIKPPSVFHEVSAKQESSMKGERGGGGPARALVVVSGSDPPFPPCPWAGVRSLFVTELYAGNYFGEIALVAEMPRSATVTVSQSSVLFVLEKVGCPTHRVVLCGVPHLCVCERAVQAIFQRFLTLVPDMKREIELMARTRSTKNLRSLKVRPHSPVSGCLPFVLCQTHHPLLSHRRSCHS